MVRCSSLRTQAYILLVKSHSDVRVAVNRKTTPSRTRHTAKGTVSLDFTWLHVGTTEWQSVVCRHSPLCGSWRWPLNMLGSYPNAAPCSTSLSCQVLSSLRPSSGDTPLDLGVGRRSFGDRALVVPCNEMK